MAFCGCGSSAYALLILTLLAVNNGVSDKISVSVGILTVAKQPKPPFPEPRMARKCGVGGEESGCTTR